MEKTKRCPHCGEEISATTKKCRFCGEWIDAPFETMPEKSKRKKTWLYVVVAAIVVAVGVGVAILFSGNNKNGVDTTEGAAIAKVDSIQEVSFDAKSLIALNRLSREEAINKLKSCDWEVYYEDETDIGFIKMPKEIQKEYKSDGLPGVYDSRIDVDAKIIVATPGQTMKLGLGYIVFTTNSEFTLNKLVKTLTELGYEMNGENHAALSFVGEYKKVGDSNAPTILINQGEKTFHVFVKTTKEP